MFSPLLSAVLGAFIAALIAGVGVNIVSTLRGHNPQRREATPKVSEKAHIA